jgi:hypothetical protein
MDYSGEFGIGPNTFYIPFNTNSEGKRLETFLNSNDYKTLALSTKTTRQYLKIAFIEHLKLTKIMGQNVNVKQHVIKKTRKNKNRNNKTRKTKYKGGDVPQFDLDILVACHCISDKRSSKLYTHYKSTIEPFDETSFKNVKYIDTNARRCIQSSNQYTNWHSITEQFDIIYAIYCPVYSLEEEVDIEISNGVYEDIFNNRILKPNGTFVIYARDEESLREVEASFKRYLQTNNLNPNSFYFMDTPYEDYVYYTPAVYSMERPDFVIEIKQK